MATASQKWLPFVSTIEKGNKIANVDTKKTAFLLTKYPISSQQHNQFQGNMTGQLHVQYLYPFLDHEAVQKPYPMRPHTQGRGARGYLPGDRIFHYGFFEK